MRAAVIAAVLFWSMTVSADTYQAIPVTLPDGKSTLAVLDTKTGRVWLLGCSDGPDGCGALPKDPPGDWVAAEILRRGTVMRQVWYRLGDGNLWPVPK